MSKEPEVIVKNELQESIEEVTQAVAQFNATEAGLAELRKKFDKVVFDVTTPKGMKAARSARQEIRQPRYEIEKLRKAAKAPILALGKRLDAKAKEITAKVLEIEEPIDKQIEDEDARIERERQAEIDAELKRIEAIQERITELRGAFDSVTYFGFPTAEKVAEFISDIEQIKIDDSFAEFRQTAQDAKDATLSRLRDLHKSALEKEAEDERIAAERAELERLRAEAAERQEREEAERKAREEKERAEREERERAEREQREREDAERRAALEAEEQALIEERRKEARRQEVQNQINVVQALPTQGYGKTAAELSRLLARAQAFTISMEYEDADLAASAATAQQEAIGAIKAMLEGRKQYEAEEAALAEAKRQKEAAEKAETERKAKAEAAARKKKFPGVEAIIQVLAEHYGVTTEVVMKWLEQLRKAA